jgi:hypothetical protein
MLGAVFIAFSNYNNFAFMVMSVILSHLHAPSLALSHPLPRRAMRCESSLLRHIVATQLVVASWFVFIETTLTSIVSFFELTSIVSKKTTLVGLHSYTGLIEARV